MGMAASQARYLGLAARRTNCEYMGQQINQSRTALANQSAELWNQMLGLSVPVVPNQTDYTTTQYSFSDGQNAFEIMSMVPTDEQEGYNYSVKYRYYEKEIKGIETANTNPQVQLKKVTTQTGDVTLDSGKLYTNISGTQEELVEITDATELAAAKEKLIASGVPETDIKAKVFKTASGVYYTAASAAAATGATLYSGLGYKVGNNEATVADTTDPDVKSSLIKIAEDNPNTKIAEAIKAGKDIYQVTKSGTTYYVTEEELEYSRTHSEAQTPTSEIDKQAALKQYYTAQVETEKVASDYALMDDASGTGRFTSIKLKNYSSTFDLKTESKVNETAYNQAMQQYYYDNQQYEKKQADINAKTELIQQQDRTLELRLKQLDTEHSALQTEMEAVKKVMDKNVEETFKTFGG